MACYRFANDVLLTSFLSTSANVCAVLTALGRFDQAVVEAKTAIKLLTPVLQEAESVSPSHRSPEINRDMYVTLRHQSQGSPHPWALIPPSRAGDLGENVAKRYSARFLNSKVQANLTA